MLKTKILCDILIAPNVFTTESVFIHITFSAFIKATIVSF